MDSEYLTKTAPSFPHDYSVFARCIYARPVAFLHTNDQLVYQILSSVIVSLNYAITKINYNGTPSHVASCLKRHLAICLTIKVQN
jgi:hypothetical protein